MHRLRPPVHPRPRPAHHVARSVACALALVALASGLSSCGDDASGPDEGLSASGEGQSGDPAQVIDVTVPGGEAGELRFDADLDDLTAGPVTMNLTNRGAHEHHAIILRLKEGEDRDSVLAAAAADPTGAEMLSLVETYGGPNGAAPGVTVSSTQVLDAGDYLLICVIPGEDGLPHFAHGMVQTFTVAPGDGPAEPPVDDLAEADVSLVDFGFSVGGAFQAGDTVTVANDGDQAHELVVLRLDEGATLADAEAALADPTAGPPPWTPAGGIGPIEPGRRATFPLPAQSGEYVFACLLPDVTGNREPHHTLGMVTSVSIA